MPNNKRSDLHSISSMIFPPIDFNDHDHGVTLGLGFGFGLESNLLAGIDVGVNYGSTDQHQFFTIPPIQELDSKPQDPIIDTLERNARVVRARVHPSERKVTEKSPKIEERHDISFRGEERKSGNGDDEVWTLPQVVASPKKCIRTWDDFYPTTTQSSALTSPFLSEQPPHVFDAIRYHLNFKLKDPTIHFRYILPDELWANLKLNILGNSSSLFIWNDTLNHFVPNTLENGKKISVTLEGVGDDVFSSVMTVFLNIGANLRRVDEFITRLRQKSLESSPIRASFLHSLASVLSYLQSILSHPPPYEMRQLVGISSWYKIYDQILKALVVLCQCDGKPPFSSFFITTPHALLDHIFTELHGMLIIKASREVSATLAYILTVTSKEYFQQLAYSIGLLDTSHRPTQDSNTTLVFDDMPSLHLEPLPLPSFFPKSLATSLPAARKSLFILKNAGLPCQAELDILFTWVWTAEELEKRWLHDRKNQRELTLLPDNQNARTHLSSSPPQSQRRLSSLKEKAKENPSSSNDDLESQVLSQFALFNLAPGSHSHLLSTNDDDDDVGLTTTAKNTSPSATATAISTFSNFLTTFPESLPTIAPTLHHLAQIILRPLSIRTTVLSNLSLRLFLDTLHFNSHLHILRSYFFLTSLSFKRRLVNALLYNETLEAPSCASWGLAGAGVAIGLAAGLSSDHKIWPPKGSDLSFSLRNVIVNSLEEDFFDNSGGGETRSVSVGLRNVVVDAEQKLGFGLRDLPVEDGNARWLDPVCIEALDFLQLDYKTSQPLDVIVTPQTIAKYQRVFTFLLRLTRVETVMRISHQTIYSNCNSPLSLPTSKKAQSIAQNLHFQLSTFISSLSGYIYDSVIGGIFDKYLTRIDQIRDELRRNEESSNSDSDIRFSNMNIFMLGESHSRLLDRILKCCLLRRGKSKNRRRGEGHGNEAGNVLRDLMDLVLRFGTVLMELKVKRRRGVSGGDVVMDDLEIEASEAEAGVEEKLSRLSKEFRAGMIHLITAIRTMQEMQTQNNKHEPQSDMFSTRSRRIDNYDFVAAAGGESNAQAQVRDLEQIHLEELLTRIDPSYWWRRQIEKREKEKIKEGGIDVWEDVVPG